MPNAQFRGLLLRAIAAFKFLKAALLIATGVGALHLVNKDLTQVAGNLVRQFHLDPGNRYVALALEHSAHLTPRRLQGLGIAAFIYAALFMVEGIGLWSLKRWGEWITVVITSSLLPVEIYELWHRPSVAKSAVLALNVLIVGYLAWRLRKS